MKHIILLFISILFCSCDNGDSEVHCDHPLEVSGITYNLDYCNKLNNYQSHSGYYMVTINVNHGERLILYTNKYYRIGDTLK